MWFRASVDDQRFTGIWRNGGSEWWKLLTRSVCSTAPAAVERAATRFARVR
jgi:hypothetical protein